ncbi:MAG: LruC domain-containing protein [Pseudohongiellaceae bacterium]|jgi:LruC domain-containing protein
MGMGQWLPSQGQRPWRRSAPVVWLLLLVAISGISASSPAPLSPPIIVEPIPLELWQMVSRALPEKTNSGLAFLHEQNSAAIELAADGTVSTTFLWETRGLRNTLGDFTYGYDLNQDVLIYDAQLVFPNASLVPDGTMISGDTMSLGDGFGAVRVFSAGTRLGFFLVAGGYNDSLAVRFWDLATPLLPSSDPAANMGEAQGVFTRVDSWYPELAVADVGRSRYVAALSVAGLSDYIGGDPFVLLGFEDLNRNENADDDFNDLIITVQSDPPNALMTPQMSSYSDSDSDGDGVSDVEDAYPNDVTRAVVLRYPTTGFHVLGVEDLYPALGDADDNDAVVVFAYELVTDAHGKVKDLQADYHLIAGGSTLDHSLGLHLPGIPSDATGVVQVERFLSDGAATHSVEDPVSVSDLIALSDRRIDNVIPCTIEALPAAAGLVFANTTSTVVETTAASARVSIHFDLALDADALGSVPYDVYFGVDHGLTYDVHLPGWPGFDDRPPWLPDEQGEGAFLDDEGNPLVIMVPYNWCFPLERTAIWSAYPSFNAWVTSEGTASKDWFDMVNPNAPWLAVNEP